MARCWTCGREVKVAGYKCPDCQGVDELQGLRGDIEEQTVQLSDVVDRLRSQQSRDADALREATEEGLKELASTIEWGFGEMRWAAELQRQALRDIDQTLRTPSETQANEWRTMAEELRRRGVCGESEEFYQRAIEANRLDFRSYVGLAETYIRMGRLGEARESLIRSMPHAPRGAIDYRSYSLRMLGRLALCEGDPEEAHGKLAEAVQLSPEYALALYDLAQYAALTNRPDDMSSSLLEAVRAEPTVWYLAASERNLDGMREQVVAILSTLTNARIEMIDSLRKSHKTIVARAEAEVSAAGSARDAFDASSPLASAEGLNRTLAAWAEVEAKASTGDYLDLLAAESKAAQALEMGTKLIDTAVQERQGFEARLAKRQADETAAANRAAQADADRMRREADAAAARRKVAKSRATLWFFLVGTLCSIAGGFMGCTAVLGGDFGAMGLGLLIGATMAALIGGGMAAAIAYSASK